MSKVISWFGAQHFTKGELIDIGWRLSESKLKEMGLLDAVVNAEQEAVWRLKAALDLLAPLTNILPESLLFELEAAEKQAINPVRGQASEFGGIARPEGRSLPKAGTILARAHDYQFYRVRKQKGPDGAERYRFNDTFRFLVVEPPCKLLRLDRPKGPIYKSPSAAARDATNSQVDGWSYFEIE